jgi:hypothetical protein
MSIQQSSAMGGCAKCLKKWLLHQHNSTYIFISFRWHVWHVFLIANHVTYAAISYTPESWQLVVCRNMNWWTHNLILWQNVCHACTYWLAVPFFHLVHRSDSCCLTELVSPLCVCNVNAGKCKTKVNVSLHFLTNVDCEKVQCSLVVKLNARVEDLLWNWMHVWRNFIVMPW